jgi:prepilin-type processing-associated H-X9-DG protein
VVAIAAVGVLVALAVPAFRSAREAARRTQCRNNLGQIGLGILNYHDRYHVLPPARQRHRGSDKQPLCSWRVLVTPYISCMPFYSQYRQDEPWSSPNNLKLSHQLEYYYHCPSDPTAREMTNYLAVVGPATAWPGETLCTSGDFTNRVPMRKSPRTREPRMTMGPDGIPDFSVGTSNTVLVVECANSGIHWMEPRDLEFDKLDFTVNGAAGRRQARAASGSGEGVSSEHPGGANALFSDGHVGFVRDRVAPEVFRAMLTIPGRDRPRSP